MHNHSQTGTTLAEDIANDLIALDAKLGHCDQEDRDELRTRLSLLDPSEFANILAVFAITLAPVAVADAVVEKASK